MYAVDYVRRHGNRAAKYWFGPFRPVVELAHPETVKLILRTSEPKALANQGVYNLLRPWLGEHSAIQ